jgi:hypothetical protein
MLRIKGQDDLLRSHLPRIFLGNATQFRQIC